MSLSAAQTTQIFEILGVPQDGSGEVLGPLASLFGSGFESYDLSAIVSRINTKLAALSAEQIARVTTLLDRNSAIGNSSPLQVSASSGGARGTLANHPAEREAIRSALGNILGIAVPGGGFIAEARRAAQGGRTVGR